MKRYYDPEYDRIVNEDVIKKQFDWFKAQKWFAKSYEQFKDDNFRKLKNYLVFSEMGHFVYDTNDFTDAKDCVYEFGGKVETVDGDILISVGV